MKDPNGKSQHEAGAKLDDGKSLHGVVLLGFTDALNEVCKVGTFGANKYTFDGWKAVPEGERRYTDAMLRHLFAGEEIDEESGMLHDAMVAWNALARLNIKLTKSDEKQQWESAFDSYSKEQFTK